MKLTITDLMVLVNTLNGSLTIIDNQHYIFEYSADYRRELSFKLQKFLSSVSVGVEVKDNET